MNGEGMRIRSVIPAIMLPCNFCAKKGSIYHAASDISEAEDLEKACRENCEDYSYFRKYGINRLIDPSIQETDYLLEMIGGAFEKYEARHFPYEEIERLRVLAQRLSFVLNLEEARISAVRSTLLRVEEL